MTHLRYWLYTSLCCICLTATAGNFNYAKQWERIAAFEAKQLPQSALQSVDSLMKAATKEQNSAQLLKGWIYRFRFLMEKDQDNFFAELKAMEQYTATDRNPTEKSILHSLLAKLYTQYYLRNLYVIGQRKPLGGAKPADIKEWSANNFADTITYHVKASLQNAQQLQATPASAYQAIMEPGKDSRTLQPTLFDFLCARGVETFASIARFDMPEERMLNDKNLFAPAEIFINQNNSGTNCKSQICVIYRQWLRFRLSDKNTTALIYTDLQRLAYIKDNSNSRNLPYMEALQKLRQKYANVDAVVEVMAKLVTCYLESDEYDPSRKEETDYCIDYKKKAFDLCAEGIRKYPNYARINVLKNTQQEISRKSFSIQTTETYAPTDSIRIRISSTNVRNIEIKLFRVNQSGFEYYKQKQLRANGQITKNALLIETYRIGITPSAYFRERDTTLLLPPLRYGNYEVLATITDSKMGNEKAIQDFSVSRLAFFNRSKSENKMDIFVVDRVSGEPQTGVTVKAYTVSGYGEKMNALLNATAASDQNGHCVIDIKKQNATFIELIQGEDKAFPFNSTWTYFNNYTPSDNTRQHLSLFTDRAIYRPGQTVYIKGIAWEAGKEISEVTAGKTYDAILRDANYREVAKQTVKTNNFGSFSAAFTLPKGGLNGYYTIEIPSMGISSFRVEEYKRPTFEVQFDTIRGTPAFGDSVLINGSVTSYAGFPIDKATVKYHIIRRPHWLMRWAGIEETELANGELKSDGKGKFHLSFVAQNDKEVASRTKQYYTYSVVTEVTDPNGETQKGEMNFSIGDISMYLTMTTNEIIPKDHPLEIEIAAFNINNAPVATNIQYTISRLKPGKEFIEKVKGENLTDTEEQVADGMLNSGKEKKLTFPHSAQWKSGKYVVTLSALDDKGRVVEQKQTFTLYSPDDKKTPVKTYCWLQEIKTTCRPGESAEVVFGTSAKKVHVLYELMDGNTAIEQKWITLDDEMQRLFIPFKSEYTHGITLQLTFVKDGQSFNRQIFINPLPVKKTLTPKFTTFRDKLLPGQKEEWKITIPELSSQKQAAECLVTMYDASLDQFARQQWDFNPVFDPGISPVPYWSFYLWNNPRNVAGNGIYEYLPVNDLDFNRFDPIVERLFQNSQNIVIRGVGRLNSGKQVQFAAPEATKDSTQVTKDTGATLQGDMMGISLNEVTTVGYGTKRKASVSGAIKNQATPNPPRSNFAETAFFYPQLRTDEKGEVSFSFTVPESLTRWNVMGLAHTKDLYFGQWVAQTVTQKPFMVQPNLPRFVRENDQLNVTAKLINLSDKQQSGTARIELIDPESEKPLVVADAVRSFTVQKDGMETVSWQLSGFANKQMLICKITASTDEFSDGEQHYLPVLPDKIRVTETLPIRVRGNQTKQFSFDRLITTANKVDNKSLSTELTANPAWYAVQALPALSLPENDCSVSWFSTYYANTLAAAIVRQNPKIANVYTQWQQSGNALQSNLEKNEEMKNLLLTETPWVLEAKNETEQKQRIAELFDPNRQTDKRNQALDKLASLQLENGAFTWFKGMYEDRFLTQYIAEGMARLQTMGAEKYGEREQEMIRKALLYADNRMEKDYSELKRYDKNWQKLKSLSANQIFYFYLRSSYNDIPVAKNAVEAVGFYQKRLASSWTECTLYGKALVAITAQRSGDKKLAADIAKSLRENATQSGEKGMYWANNRGGIWWHESNIATQTAIMEALTSIDGNIQQSDDMKLWLLSQKQTEKWHSPIATADAVYALLSGETNLLSGDNDVVLKLGNSTVKTDKKEAGTGYEKNTFAASDIHPEMGEITLTNNTPHPAWGAVYWQYETSIDNVSAQKGLQLNVDKRLFVEQASPNGSVLMPVSAGTPLKVGDKITVRLTVNTDRDMEYVALTDQRAACLEPAEQLSGFRWKERIGYYQSTKDASTQFFFANLPKGTYVFEYATWVTRTGTYSNGIATIQCQYAPEFSAHTAGEKLTVK